MLKIMSAALLAASVIAAPAFAETKDKATTTAPVIKSEKAPAAKTEAPAAATEQAKAPAAKSTDAKSKALNANAKVSHRKHHHPKHMGLLKTHTKPVAAIKHTSSVVKHG